jgi:hypothetical protein
VPLPHQHAWRMQCQDEVAWQEKSPRCFWAFHRQVQTSRKHTPHTHCRCCSGWIGAAARCCRSDTTSPMTLLHSHIASRCREATSGLGHCAPAVLFQHPAPPPAHLHSIEQQRRCHRSWPPCSIGGLSWQSTPAPVCILWLSSIFTHQWRVRVVCCQRRLGSLAATVPAIESPGPRRSAETTTAAQPACGHANMRIAIRT